MRTYQPPHRPPRRRQQGLVLVVALILMAVIGVASTAAMRLALTSSTIALGLRAQDEATQAAEVALRWCEVQARLQASGAVNGLSNDFTLLEAPATVDTPPLWQTLASFTANSRPVPAAIMAAAGMPALGANQLPRCLAQESDDLKAEPAAADSNLSSKNNVFRQFVITVRAFSPDFRTGTNGEDGGSEVWLQSNLIWSSRK
jgi:Tfp pilus assembly protein PilX